MSPIIFSESQRGPQCETPQASPIIFSESRRGPQCETPQVSPIIFCESQRSQQETSWVYCYLGKQNDFEKMFLNP